MATVSANPMAYEDGITRPVTADELSAITEAKALETAMQKEQNAKDQAQTSAIAKLEAMGLNASEIAALISK